MTKPKKQRAARPRWKFRALNAEERMDSVLTKLQNLRDANAALKQAQPLFYTFTVTRMQRAQFPIDMLRFDACFPLDTASSIAIFGATRSVVLGAWHPEKWLPSVLVWESCGWAVSDVAQP